MTATADALRIGDVTFQNPILLAAGTAGFGRELDDVIALNALGGIITKSVSPEPRAGYPAPRVAEFAGGMLNAVGLANPGMDAVRTGELSWLERHLTRARVLVSVVGNTVSDYGAVVAALGGHPAVSGFELNLSCPNTDRGGEHFGANDTVLADLVRRCRGETDRLLSAKLAPTLPDIGRSASVAAAAGADAISVINTIPGALFATGHGVAKASSRLGAGQGGVSGPALLAIGVLAVRRVRDAAGVPVIGMGGVWGGHDVAQYLAAGATLVAVGTAALADPRIPERLAARSW